MTTKTPTATATIAPDQRRARVEAARIDFPSYCRYVHRFNLPLHYRSWADLLDSASPEAGRVAISAPPEFGKSRTVRMWIEFSIGRRPDWCRILAMNVASQAEKQVMAIEQTIRYNPRYHEVFPDVIPDESRGWNKTLFFVMRHNSERPDPTLMGTGSGGPVQGLHVEEIFVDDLVDQQDLRSPSTMDAHRDFVLGVLYDRLIRERDTGLPVGKFYAIMTRWGEADLWPLFTNSPYHPEDPGMGFMAVQTPAVREGDPYPWGEFLYPDEFGAARLEQIRIEKGNDLFTMTYLCDPSAMGGIVFDRSRFNRFDLASPPEFDFKLHSWDTASGESNDASFSVMEEWCAFKGGFAITHLWRARPTFTQLKSQVYRFTADRLPNLVLIENKGDGVGLIRDIKADGGLPQLRDYKPIGSKTERARKQTSLLDNGRLWIPTRAPWLDEFLRELTGFPKGRYDDQVDAMTQALDFLRDSSPSRGKPAGSWMGTPAERTGPGSAGNGSWL